VRLHDLIASRLEKWYQPPHRRRFCRRIGEVDR
jgi:hypothetical protein